MWAGLAIFMLPITFKINHRENLVSGCANKREQHLQAMIWWTTLYFAKLSMLQRYVSETCMFVLSKNLIPSWGSSAPLSNTHWSSWVTRKKRIFLQSNAASSITYTWRGNKLASEYVCNNVQTVSTGIPHTPHPRRVILKNTHPNAPSVVTARPSNPHLVSVEGVFLA